MFRKVMQIGDSLMYRYYELLTDTTMVEIAAMQERIAKNELHPMEAKMELGKLVVADFHSASDAAQAAERFTREVRQKEVPADIPVVPLPDGVMGPAGLHVDKLVARIGLVESVTEAGRKRKAGAVEINGTRVLDVVFSTAGPWRDSGSRREELALRMKRSVATARTVAAQYVSPGTNIATLRARSYKRITAQLVWSTMIFQPLGVFLNTREKMPFASPPASFVRSR